MIPHQQVHIVRITHGVLMSNSKKGKSRILGYAYAVPGPRAQPGATVTVLLPIPGNVDQSIYNAGHHLQILLIYPED